MLPANLKNWDFKKGVLFVNVEKMLAVSVVKDYWEKSDYQTSFNFCKALKNDVKSVQELCVFTIADLKKISRCNVLLESRRAYNTAVSRAVIHLNKIHLNHSQILTITQCSNNPKPNLNPSPNPP